MVVPFLVYAIRLLRCERTTALFKEPRQHLDMGRIVSRLRFAAMGRLAIERPESRELVPMWKSQPGMLGVCLTLTRNHHRVWLSAGTADRLQETAERHVIPVMASATGSLPKIAEVAARHPGAGICGMLRRPLPLRLRNGPVHAVVDGRLPSFTCSGH